MFTTVKGMSYTLSTINRILPLVSRSTLKISKDADGLNRTQTPALADEP